MWMEIKTKERIVQTFSSAVWGLVSLAAFCYQVADQSSVRSSNLPPNMHPCFFLSYEEAI